MGSDDITSDLFKAKEHIIDGVLSHDISRTVKINLIKTYATSKLTLENYVILDYEYRHIILGLINAIITYNDDSSINRPLNYLMYAFPGSGKTHFVKSFVKNSRLSDFCEEVIYNMSSFNGVEDFAYPLETARNVKINNKLPILFLDEIDSNDQLFPVILPLLWDGELPIAGRDLRIGKSVIMLSISKEEIIKNATKEGIKIPKIDDFLSRINGGLINIPPLDLVTTRRDLRADKICITLSLLENKYNKRIKIVPWNLLYFVGHISFKFGVRSIAFLIEQLPRINETHGIQKLIDSLDFLKSERSLKKSFLFYHLDADQIEEAVELWNSVVKNKSTVIFR